MVAQRPLVWVVRGKGDEPRSAAEALSLFGLRLVLVCTWICTMDCVVVADMKMDEVVAKMGGPDE